MKWLETSLFAKTTMGVRHDRDISHLPKWVRTPKQITDGHLAELARANEAVLATLDRRIPGAFVIPLGRHP